MAQIDTYGLRPSGGIRESRQIDYDLGAFAQRLDHGDEGPEYFFWRIVSHFFGPKSDYHFVRTPQAETLVKEFCEQPVVVASGHASSCKSATSGMWAVINLMADPKNTKVPVISTDLKGARKRIWGTIEEIIYALPKDTFSVTKTGLIMPVDPTGNTKFSERCGIELVAGNKNKERDALEKLRGFKTGKIEGGRCIVIIDEGPGVADGIYEVYFSNVEPGNKYPQLIALGNFDNIASVFGQLCEPVEGWDSITVDDEKWPNNRGGVTIHFDALKSPNWLAKEDIHPFMMSWKSIQKRIDADETDTLAWWRDVRSFPAPAGMGDAGICTLNELRMFKATTMVHPEDWKTPPVLFLGNDPAFVSGGDDPVLFPLAVGALVTGEHVLCCYKPDVIPIDSNNKLRPPVYQIADYNTAYCVKSATPKASVGYDSTNEAFSQVFATEFGREAYAVSFGGAASEDRIGKKGPNGEAPQRACDVYRNRVSELHGMFLTFLRAGRIRGIDPTSRLCKELLTRRWEDLDYTGSKPKMVVESKRKMKSRTGGISPDILDGFLVALATAIRRLRITADTTPQDKEERLYKRWERQVRQTASVPVLNRHIKAGSSRHGVLNALFKRK